MIQDTKSLDFKMALLADAMKGSDELDDAALIDKATRLILILKKISVAHGFKEEALDAICENL